MGSDPKQKSAEEAAVEAVMKMEPPIVLTNADEDAKEKTERFLRVMDRSQEGSVRTVVPLGNDDSGNPLQVIVWRKP